LSKKSNITLQNSQVYVVIDLETTGLDSANDQIIDIGAVKFNENETLETYSTLIKPDRPISQFITQLTSISNKDVMKAPKFDDIKDELKQFLSNLPIIGHNVKFDLSISH
jgi:DNA polymerase III epsilon subunit family exonuclease